ncbi:MAG TPA: MFS transporter [Chitinophagaceae bacterium]
MSTDRTRHDPFASVRIIEFRNLLMGRFLFIMGLRMMGTLVGWWIYQLTKDPFAIGLIGLSEVIPALSFALYAGHVIDQSEKRKLLLKGMSFYLMCAIVLLGLSTQFTTSRLSNSSLSYCIYFVVFCTGIIRAFTGPVFHTLLAAIVPKAILSNATTWNQGTWLTASVTGHALGGFIIAGMGNTGTLVVIVALVVFSFFYMTLLKPRPPIAAEGEKKTWKSIMEGLRFVVRTKEVLGALTLDLFAVLFGGAVAMLPAFATDILHVGSEGFGLLNAATDMGAIISVITLTLFPLRRKQGRTLLLGVAGFGACIIIFALSEFFWLSFAALLVSGVLDGFSVVIRGTILQLMTPDNMRGRVMSVNSMFINSSNELGQFESGVAARLLGVIPSVIFGGCMTILVVIITWFKAPTLRKMEYRSH